MVDSPSVSLSPLKKNLLSLLEDLLFYEPTQAFVKVFKARSAQAPQIWQYAFDQANPFEGAFKGIPSHALDLAYLHGNLDIFE
jgi:carboxylesterase type B